MMSNKTSLTLVVGLAILVLLAKLSSCDDEAERNIALDAEGKSDARSFSIPSWSSYMRYFNKKYSSLSQQILRQKLFIARAMEVFLTRIKYRLSQLSYYTAINEYSDATPDEGRRMLSGDHSDEGLNEDPPLEDEEEAEKLLLEALKEGMGALSEDNNKSRKRRSVDNASADISKIRWKVPSNNPDYEPLKVSVDVESVHVERVAEDIPADRAAEIEIGATQSRYSLTRVASGGIGRMKSIIGGAMDWLSNDEPKAELEGTDSIANLDDQDATETTVIVDWLASGCMGPVRNQGDCLSCYAISSIGFMEWALCRDHGKSQVTPLSVQYMVSCGPQYKDETGGKVRLDGCFLGTSRHTVDFIREYGLELEANMPYLEQDTSCPLEPYTPRKKKGYIRPNMKPAIRLKASTNQLDLALKSGPVIVGMWEPKNFLAYGGGMVEHCYQEGGHAMLIVGAMIEKGEEYLLIKNSFGPGWGYDGYFKFRRSSIGECVKEFIVPRVNFPGKKAQARRIKAYLAGQQSVDEDDDTELSGTILVQ